MCSVFACLCPSCWFHVASMARDASIKKEGRSRVSVPACLTPWIELGRTHDPVMQLLQRVWSIMSIGMVPPSHSSAVGSCLRVEPFGLCSSVSSRESYEARMGTVLYNMQFRSGS